MIRRILNYCSVFGISHVCRETTNLISTSSIFCMKDTKKIVQKGLF